MSIQNRMLMPILICRGTPPITRLGHRLLKHAMVAWRSYHPHKGQASYEPGCQVLGITTGQVVVDESNFKGCYNRTPSET